MLAQLMRTAPSSTAASAREGVPTRAGQPGEACGLMREAGQRPHLDRLLALVLGLAAVQHGDPVVHVLQLPSNQVALQAGRGAAGQKVSTADRARGASSTRGAAGHGRQACGPPKNQDHNGE